MQLKHFTYTVNKTKKNNISLVFKKAKYSLEHKCLPLKTGSHLVLLSKVVIILDFKNINEGN